MFVAGDRTCDRARARPALPFSLRWKVSADDEVGAACMVGVPTTKRPGSFSGARGGNEVDGGLLRVRLVVWGVALRPMWAGDLFGPCVLAR